MLSLPEKMIRNFSGVRRRSREQKKVFLRKRCEARFLGMGRKNGLCLGWCMCSRNYGERKGNL